MSITNHFKSALAGIGMLLLAFNVAAYPLLTFDGGMNYNSETKLFGVAGTLTGAQDISSAPLLSGSTFQFAGLFDSSSIYTNASITVAKFIGLTGGSAPLLQVIDGNSILLLEGELSGLVMGGANGSSTGALGATFNPTGGSLINEFAVGARLFALQLNLTTNFDITMFNQSFAGNVDGRLSAPASVSVPEPGVLVLFMLGLGVLVISTRKKSGQTF